MIRATHEHMTFLAAVLTKYRDLHIKAAQTGTKIPVPHSVEKAFLTAKNMAINFDRQRTLISEHDWNLVMQLGNWELIQWHSLHGTECPPTALSWCAFEPGVP